MSNHTTPGVALDASFGLAAWGGQPQSMSVAHRHDDVELNYLAHGQASYRFGDQQLDLAAGELCLFWAARPHQLRIGEHPPLLHWVTIPLVRFLSWGLPSALCASILAGGVLRSTHPSPAGAAQHIERWRRDLAGGTEQLLIARLELEALLRRLWLQLADDRLQPTPGERSDGCAERMARYIVEHYQQPLPVEAIADHVGLHPHYAMQRFRQAYGVTLHTYLTHYRIACAQQLLATTDRGVLEIGLEAGFGSASRFYSAFKAVCGQTPAAYRQSLR